jgi:hypothetical protein
LENKNILDYYFDIDMKKNNLFKDYIYSYIDNNINDDITNDTTTHSIIDDYKYYKVVISDFLYKSLNINTINQGLILNKNNIKIGDVHILKYEPLTKELIFKTKVNISRLYSKIENWNFYSEYIVFSKAALDLKLSKKTTYLSCFNQFKNQPKKNIEIIFDTTIFSFTEIITFMQLNKNKNLSFKNYILSSNYLIGSNNSNDRGQISLL